MMMGTLIAMSLIVFSLCLAVWMCICVWLEKADLDSSESPEELKGISKTLIQIVEEHRKLEIRRRNSDKYIK